MHHFDDVRFITASDAVRLCATEPSSNSATAEPKRLPRRSAMIPAFNSVTVISLSAAEIFAILSQFVAEAAVKGHGGFITRNEQSVLARAARKFRSTVR